MRLFAGTCTGRAFILLVESRLNSDLVGLDGLDKIACHCVGVVEHLRGLEG